MCTMVNGGYWTTVFSKKSDANTDPKYTSVSNTYGYITGNFTGNYYYFGAESNNAIIHGEARGGDISTFFTTLYIWMWDAINVDERIYYDTDEGNRLMQDTLKVTSNDICGRANGYVEGTSCNVNNSSDKWQAYYLYFWCGAQSGWQ